MKYNMGIFLKTLMACTTSCELADIESSDECNLRGGIKTVYIAKYSEIDWATMLADPLQFDSTTQEILDYTMVGGGVFVKYTFERETAQYENTYSADSSLYEQAINLVFEGKGLAIRNALNAAVGCCKLVIHVFDNNCDERVFGVEYDGSTFEIAVTPMRITEHLDASGEFGTSIPRDEITLGGKAIHSPLYADVTEAAMPV